MIPIDVVFQRMDHGMNHYQVMVYHHIDDESIHAILQVHDHHLNFLLINNHYIKPIYVDYNLKFY